MSFEIGKTFKFESAHQLKHHGGKCSRPHGHSYQFELIVERRDLQLHGPAAGMVNDYDHLTEVGTWIEDRLDHRDLNEVLDSDTTTAEELSTVVWSMASSRLPNLVEIRFKETAKTYVSLRPRRAEENRALELGASLVQKLRDRLYKGVDASDPDACWLFPSSVDDQGYGWFSLPAAKTKKSHRAAAWLAGDDITGKVVMHLCDTPSCINPEHLYTGTHAENEADKDAKGRRRVGEDNPHAKITSAEVREIVYLVQDGQDRRTVASQFNVSTSLVYAIMAGRVWRHITKFPRPK